MVIADTLRDPASALLPSTVQMGVRAYVGVPVLRSDGTVFGTLCGLDPSPRAVAADTVAWMQILAGLLVFHIERDDLKRRKDELIDAASHDLRQPLTSIIGHVQLLRHRLARDGKMEADRLLSGCEAIETAARNMQAQTADLLDAARLRMGRPLELRRTPVDLVDLARRAVSEHQQASETHDLRFEATLPALVAMADQVRLGRVLANLLSNAVKYSPAGGEIAVGVERDDGLAGSVAVLTVRDHGIGIPAAHLPHLFERSSRGGNVGPISGTGIGLAVTREIVRQHGGSIDVESREGEGSTFTVRFPIAAVGDSVESAT